MPLVPILMPQLGESIAEGTVVNILISKGDNVEADQEILEVETQKATMGVPTICGGKVVEISAELDTSYPIGHVLGIIETSDEEVERTGAKTLDDIKPKSTIASTSPAAKKTKGKQPKGKKSADKTSHFGPQKETHVEESAGVQPHVHGLPVPASATGASYISPRMRARMAELGMNAADLAGIAGSGAGGRVTVQDFERFLREIESTTTTNASALRVAVADSMRRAWTRPLATVGRSVSLEPLLAHRRKQSDPKPGPALYALRALAIALSENPAVGGRLIGKRIVHPEAIDIGFAVEVEHGVIVPVLRSADKISLKKMTAPYQDLVGRARNRKLKAAEHRPGVATVTNFGTFGIVWATPIPLPEQNLVLGLGTGRKMPVWNEEKQTFIPVVQAELTLSFDHRILDGGGAGRLLQRICELLAKPEKL